VLLRHVTEGEDGPEDIASNISKPVNGFIQERIECILWGWYEGVFYRWKVFFKDLLHIQETT